MTTRSRNPAALDNPKLRLFTTDIAKEVIIVDDDSKDGTRGLLEKMAELQAKGETTASTLDGTGSLSLRELRFFFQSPN